MGITLKALLDLNGIANQSGDADIRVELEQQRAINHALMQYMGVTVRDTGDGYEVVRTTPPTEGTEGEPNEL